MEVIWSKLAVEQLSDITEYVEDNFGVNTAKKMVRNITEKVGRLLLHPSIGIPDYKFTANIGEDILIRHIQIFPNVLYYIVKSDKIIVICIMHEKQSPKTVSEKIMDFLKRQ